MLGATNRFAERSVSSDSESLTLALPLSKIWPATRMSVIAAARPIATFLRSFDVRVFWFVWLTVVSGTAATMLVPTSFLHLEGCGTHPIGWSVLDEADKRY